MEVNHAKTLAAAFRYSIPVLLGYLALGAAYGLVLTDSGLPWWLAPLSGVVIYAGAGQFLAVALFSAGAGIAEVLLAEIVLNARHLAYGISLHKRINGAGRFKWYLIYALADETFALISSLPGEEAGGQDRTLLMVYIAALNQFYWVCGSLTGAVLGTLIPFNFEGVGFALTALFVVLMVEQIRRVKKPGPFASAALVSVAAVAILPARFALLAALVVSVALAQGLRPQRRNDASGEEP
ncbi:MAG: AzlC family ABC transporter permease [Spirochaetaceae bacterium]|jgi:4-azaleucine resistance transporter AzlC|nr:AzlC family ABC transporter permease [Spirochaetaceae bacterium]